MNYQKISRHISYCLRHDPTAIDAHGWAVVEELIERVRKKYPEFDRDILRDIVETDEKGRYSYDQWGKKIRANQGHSVNVDVELEKMTPPEFLYHGTATRFLDSIWREGLDGRTRLYVHLSKDVETAEKVGARHGQPVILKVKTGEMGMDGYEFFLSENHVWLTKAVPPKYLELL